MNAKRFFSQTARDALRQVKDEFGADAVVLSNRPVDGGVEILAAPASAFAEAPPVAAPRAPAPSRASAPSRADDSADFTVSLSSSVRQRQQRGVGSPWAPFEPPRVSPDGVPARAPRAPAPQRAGSAEPRTGAPRPAAPPAPEPLPAAEPAGAPTQAPPAPVMAELQAIRALIERQLAGFAWGDLSRAAPLKATLLGELLEAGFSGELAHRLVDALPAECERGAALNLIKTHLGRDLLTLGSDTDIIDRGGVFALVGPTGVGKTTTTAKLAARCVVRHGADRLALITTDSYRIGAHEQLRIYGRILGVPVHVIRDGADLRQTLAQLRDKHMVLIDTAGVGQRDRMVAEQAAMLIDAGDVSRLLLLNATSRGDTLDDVVRAYSGPDLAGCILTKVDEAVSLAPSIDVLVRNELELFYVTNGQRVPEDLHLPNRPYLLHRAMRLQPENSPHRLAPGEAGLLAGAPRTAAAAGGRLA